MFSDVVWTVLRSIDTDDTPFDVPNTVVMAMRIRATDQLSGRIDRLSVNATRVLKAWNGSAWVDTATRSPAWAYADVLTGVATRTAKALSEVDGDELLAWANWCATNDLFFDLVVDSQGSVFDRARDAAAAGLAAWNISEDGKVSVVRDVSGQTPVALISPRVSSSFSMERRYKQNPHAFRVPFCASLPTGLFAGRRSAGAASQVDLVGDVLLELMRLPPPNEAQGGLPLQSRPQTLGPALKGGGKYGWLLLEGTERTVLRSGKLRGDLAPTQGVEPRFFFSDDPTRDNAQAFRALPPERAQQARTQMFQVLQLANQDAPTPMPAHVGSTFQPLPGWGD